MENYILNTNNKTIVGAINELDGAVDRINDFLFTDELNKAGTLIYTKNDGNYYAVAADEWSDDLGTQVGVIVIPQGLLPDGRARIIGIKGVDSAGILSDTEVTMSWGGNGDVEGLTNYDEVPLVDPGTNEITGKTDGSSYLPSDKFSTRPNPLDIGTAWYSSSNLLAPSPYKDGVLNPAYCAAEYTGGTIANCLSDFSGLENTQLLCQSAGTYVAANAAHLYRAFDGDTLEWYLPAMGELGFIMPRFNAINEALASVGGVALASSKYFWSSSEASSDSARTLSTSDGYVYNYSSKSYSFRVRPFARLDSIVFPEEDNLDTRLQSKQDKIDNTLTTESKEVVGAINEIKSVIDAKVLELQYENLWYGIEKDMSVGDPACTRIGNMALHRTLPIQNRQKGCLMADDGSIVKYLNPDTWEDEIRDGSQGQVMVEIPDHYRYVNLDENNKLTVKLSEYPLPGFIYFPKRYVSAYEATVQRSTNKLSSVVNPDVDYRGGNNNDAWDGTYRSLLGKPATGISKTNFRTYARNRGEKWNIWTYAAYREMYWLFIVEYATLNSQAGFNAELTSEGFKQGGLGWGVSTWSDEGWNNYSGYYPFIPCGASDSLGNYSGEVSYTIKDTDGVSDLKSFMIPRYRGVEHPFGHIWKWVDGYNMNIDDSRSVYVTDNPAFFVDGTSEGLIYIGNEPTTGGYLKEMNIDSYGNFCPKTVGASSTTYFNDYFYSPVSVGASGWRALLLGGYASSGGSAGLSYFYSTASATYLAASVGARLCFVP